VLGALRRETDDMIELVTEPAHWNVPTACAGWEVRDMVGHLIDATESYLAGFALVRSGHPAAPGSVGVGGMAQASDEAARTFRSLARDVLLTRLDDTTDRLMLDLESLSAEDWSGLIIPDRYMGPLPAMIIAAGSLGGMTVHSWDVREGLGAPHALSAESADLLVPFVFLLWWATADVTGVDAPYSIGIRTTGHNGGDTRFDVSNEGLLFSPGDIDTCPAILEFDPASLVLTGYGRINGGTIRGDRDLATKFRSLFVPI